jgi:hypothetical protein
MKFLTIFSIWILSNYMIHGDEQAIKMKISSLNDQITLEEQVSLSVEISGLDLSKIEEQAPDFEMVPQEFLFQEKGLKLRGNLLLKPKTLGEHVVGPIVLDIDGQRVESNVLKIDVVKSLAGQLTMMASSSKEPVEVGEEFEVKLSCSGGSYGLKFDLGEIENLEVISHSSSVTTSTINGKMTTSSSKTYKVKALKVGHVLIKRDDLKGLAESCEMKDLLIHVN